MKQNIIKELKVEKTTPETGNDSRAMRELLEKTRQVNRALQGRREGASPDYNKLARLLCEFSTANVYVLSSEGQILGYSWVSEYHSEAIASFIEQGYMLSLIHI